LPISGGLDIRLDGDDPQLLSPRTLWQAAEAPVLSIVGAFTTKETKAQVFWATLDEPGLAPERMIEFPIVGDRVERTYEVRLDQSPKYRGAITWLRIDPIGHGHADDRLLLKSVRLLANATDSEADK
jgi:hypothetical protein